MIDWVALSTYTFVMSITPGPNNIMLLASGARFGIRRTLPHLTGVSVGFTAQTVAVCAGLGVVAEWLPGVQAWLTWAGVAFMAWLSVRLLRSGPPAEAATSASARPLSFLQAVLFQAINPKSWMKAVTLASVFMPPGVSPIEGALVITIVGFVIGFPCVSAWALFGVAIRRVLEDPRRRRVFNVIMAGALALLALKFLL